MGRESRIRIVLCRPEGSLNVGAVCRAMKTMGLTRLTIVGRREHLTEDEVRTAALHAADVYEGACFTDSLEAALAETVLSAGVTRRRGSRRKLFSLLPEELADRVAGCDGEVAAVFGNERTGLTDGELALCTVAVHIPSSPAFPSLNLSHAVQIIAYTLYLRGPDPLRRSPVPRERVEEVVETVIGSLHAMGYFKLTDGKVTAQLFRDVLTRAALHEREAERLARLFRNLPFIDPKEPR